METTKKTSWIFIFSVSSPSHALLMNSRRRHLVFGTVDVTSYKTPNVLILCEKRKALLHRTDRVLG